MKPGVSAEEISTRLREDLGGEEPRSTDVRMLLDLREISELILSADQIARLQNQLRRAAQLEQRGFKFGEWQPYLLIRAQLSLVYRTLWVASALMYMLGFLVTLYMSIQGGGAIFFVFCAPMIAATGMALLFQAESTQAFEIERAMPVPLTVIILARMTLIFVYDLGLALLASLGLSLIFPSLVLGQIINAWFGPMVFLSALAFLVSVVSRSATGGITFSMILWFFYTGIRFSQFKAIQLNNLFPPMLPIGLVIFGIVMVIPGLWWLSRGERTLDGGLNG